MRYITSTELPEENLGKDIYVINNSSTVRFLEMLSDILITSFSSSEFIRGSKTRKKSNLASNLVRFDGMCITHI